MRTYELDDPAEHVEVWRLTHDEYARLGYSSPRPDGMLRHYPHLDLIEETSVVVARDDDGELLGTNSLTVDGPAGLHVDATFPGEVDAVRRYCQPRIWALGASWRIVVRHDVPRKLETVLGLIGHTRKLVSERDLDLVLYSFHPKHERFYQKAIGAVTLAGPRPDTIMDGAPAILMRTDRDRLKRFWHDFSRRRRFARQRTEKET